MKPRLHHGLSAAALAGGLALLPIQAGAEDIDLFVGGTGANANRPNILILLDNTSNWARQSQKWPGGLQQGQAEVRAIKNALADLTGKVNVGVLEFVTQGSANDNGAFVRMALKELSPANQTVLNAHLDKIYNDINDPIEKRNSGTEYGNQIYDIYNYLGGFNQVQNGAGTPATLADKDGYATQYSTFKSPLTEASVCADTYLIVITNPNSSGPTSDTATNSAKLKELLAGVSGTAARLAGDSGGTPLPIPLFNSQTVTTTTPLGTTAACYKASETASVLAQFPRCAPGGEFSNCLVTQGAKCSGNGNNTTYKWSVTGVNEEFVVTPTGNYNTTAGAAWNLDDWTKFLYVHGVPTAFTDPTSGTETKQRIKVVTYTIDVFNAQQNNDHTGLMMSAASAGGGKYFAARNQEAIEDALKTIFSEILSVNSTFASASLPVNATNRTQNENQVFIGMFRPDGKANPRWFGNLKRYQLGNFGGRIDLADASGGRAINTLSGFVTECATSFWTVDSNNYWEGMGVSPDPRSKCLSVATEKLYSDSPDGPFVEKGGAAQQLRQSTIATRNILTAGGGGLTSFSTASSGLDEQLVKFIRGEDVFDMKKDPALVTPNLTEPRPDIHGDVIHSRPLAVNYGNDIVVFYGANDGTFRAVGAGNGKERWSFVAPEHYGKLKRLYDNEPKVFYPEQIVDPDLPADKQPIPKDYFFDGSVGALLDYGEGTSIVKAYIYPTMRRGGRMVYAFNVSSPGSPGLMWKKGCDANGSCSAGYGKIGQTWSVPNPGYVKEGDTVSPVLVMGGGYDACDDTDSASNSCSSSSKGSIVYVIDALTGSVIRSFDTGQPVPADVSLIDIDYDGYIDYAYAADTGGSLYRINFIDPVSKERLASGSWSMTKIAYTRGSGRKFLYGPAVMAYQGEVYLAIGSGDRERPLEVNYPYASGVQNRFYVYLDDPTDNASYNLDSDALFNYSGSTSCDSARITPDAEKRGWYMNLSGRGEQTVTQAVIISGMVTFSTARAGGASANVCERPLGIAEGYWVNLLNASGAIGVDGNCGGSRKTEFAGGGLPPSPVVATVPVDGKNRTVVIGSVPKDGSVGTPLSAQEPKVTVKPVRTPIYWSTDIDK